MAGNPSIKRICVGTVSGAHGIRGEIKLRSFTTDPFAIGEYGPLTNESGSKQYRLQITGETAKHLIARIEGIEDRNAAENLRGTDLFVMRDALPQTQENEYYFEDLSGLKVITAEGTPFGTVLQAANYGAGDLLEIRLSNGELALYPFTHETFPQVDLTAGTITICPPLELEAKEGE